MGILNLTPDSFFDGGQYNNDAIILKHVEQMVNDGATIIDIGGMSSRPNAQEISVEAEINRVIPTLKKIRQAFPNIFISIDTYRSEVASVAIDEGIDIINDISAGNIDEQLIDVVAKSKLPYIIMHMQNTPSNMQDNPNYNDIVLDIMDFFNNKIIELRNKGIKDIILDVGFGFGKTIAQNYILLKHITKFNVFNCPILVGISRKSMLYKLLAIEPQDALNASTAAHMLALQNGASILRVHDVKAAKECIDIWNFYRQVD
ncbi:MAG: dihydropteroate synthase [Chitinophagales bacterium]|nr:dihydropteroate synthase [Chitinophagales bacterium]